MAVENYKADHSWSTTSKARRNDEATAGGRNGKGSTTSNNSSGSKSSGNRNSGSSWLSGLISAAYGRLGRLLPNSGEAAIRGKEYYKLRNRERFRQFFQPWKFQRLLQFLSGL